MGACASPVQHEWNRANGCQISSCTIPQASAGHEIGNTFVRSRHFGALRCIHLPQRQWEFKSILFLVQIECAKVAYVMCVGVCLCELWISQKLLPTQLVLARAELRECYSCHVYFQHISNSFFAKKAAQSRRRHRGHSAEPLLPNWMPKTNCQEMPKRFCGHGINRHQHKLLWACRVSFHIITLFLPVPSNPSTGLPACTQVPAPASEGKALSSCEFFVLTAKPCNDHTMEHRIPREHPRPERAS